MIDSEILSPALHQALSRRFANIVIFSGAGMSAESGIPTFRSGENGLWSEFNPADLANNEAWKANKSVVWGWYEWRRGVIQAAQPNPAHWAVARMNKALGAITITQNVDDLHERAGIGDVLHLHGSMFAPRCATCGQPHTFDAPPPNVPRLQIPPPLCSGCGGFVRPGVVWFGEQLNPVTMKAASQHIAQCDLLLVVGTSGVVYPAAGLVALAPKSALVVEINPNATTQSGRMNFVVRRSAAQALPEVAAVLQAYTAPATSEVDALYQQALAIVLAHRQASVALIQIKLGLGCRHALSLMEAMVHAGVLSAHVAGDGYRQILWSEEDVLRYLRSLREPILASELKIVGTAR